MTDTANAGATNRPLLEMRDIGKRFGAITALDRVSPRLYAGEVLGVVGDSGAGKSTLIKALSGLYTASDGELVCDGRPVVPRAPKDAQRIGIGMVCRDLALAGNLPIHENLYLGREPGTRTCGFTIVDHAQSRRMALEHLGRLQIHVKSVDQRAMLPAMADVAGPPWPPAILVGPLVGVMCGPINGFGPTALRLPRPFIKSAGDDREHPDRQPRSESDILVQRQYGSRRRRSGTQRRQARRPLYRRVRRQPERRRSEPRRRPGSVGGAAPVRHGAAGVEALLKLANGETLADEIDTGAERVTNENAANYQ